MRQYAICLGLLDQGKVGTLCVLNSMLLLSRGKHVPGYVSWLAS